MSAAAAAVLSIVILAAPGEWTNSVVNALDDRFTIEAIILEKPVSRLTRVKRRAAHIGVVREADQVAFSALVVPMLRWRARGRLASLRHRLGADREVPSDRVVHVDSVNSQEVIDELRRRDPTLVLVSGTRVISEEVINSVPAPFVNMHAGITPRYRGVHGAYWALAEGRPESAGVTVHLIDPGIDTGPILRQARVAPSAEDSFVTYPYLQLEAGLPILAEVIDDALQGHVDPVESLDATESHLWYHPGAIDYLVRRRHAGVR